ncbi:MAG: EI24 domain-containing protein [Amaricoccus sp.]|uniref:EI24 domain-containing protein n=1 Tax=Amaricoccus sp. TaxID=1872485 RepID=UPI0039E66DCE
MGVLVDFGRALGQLGDPRFLRILGWSLLVTLAGLAALFWAVMTGLGAVLPETVTLPWLGSVTFIDTLVDWAAVALMLALSVVLMVPVAAGVVGFFLEGVAEAVEARHYPHLPPARSLGLAEQVGDALRFFLIVCAANLVGLVIYFSVAPLAPVIFWVVNGFLLGREYFQLVATRRLGRAAAADLGRRHFWRTWVVGTAMAIPLSVPILNLIVPILGVAVFTHQYHRLAGDAET